MKHLLLAVAFLLALVCGVRGQVPGILNYQGRISVDSVNYTGTGQFKFALVDAAGNQTFWSHDGSSVSGAEPATAIQRTVQAGLFDVLLGDASLPNMTPIPAAVFTQESVWLRVWFSDGSGPFEQLSPDTRIAAVGYALVADSVRAGAITGSMLASGAVDSTHLADGSVTAAKLAPGVGAGGGGSLPSGGMVLASDPESEALAAAGLVATGRNELGGERWTSRMPSQFLAGRNDAVVVWTGTEVLVWGGSSQQSYSTLLADGGRFNPQTNTWTGLSSVGAPSPRIKAKAVWTGSQMIVWGGHDHSGANGGPFELSTGGIYTPATDSWTPLPTTGALPSARYSHTAIWTGAEMIVWGGRNSAGHPIDGGRYNVASGSWLPMSSAHGLEGRTGHSAVWTGTSMIVWGGGSDEESWSHGARYLPATDTWIAMPDAPGFKARGHVAAWTGSRMVVHGGYFSNFGTYYNDGGRSFDPTSNTWSTITPLGAGWRNLRSVWTGSSLLVAGEGSTNNDIRVAAYFPATDSWQSGDPTSSGPRASTDYSTVWTGTAMLALGDGTATILGSRYTPVTNVWSALPPADFGSPPPRTGHTTVWTGTEAIVFGGTSTIGTAVTVSGGARYSITNNAWNALPTENAPSPRVSHTAVWTGSEMLVWGGRFDLTPLGDGARYQAATNTWSPISMEGAPSPRHSHTAIWTGTHMIVHGGANPSALTDTWLYAPDTDTWTAASQSPLDARLFHTATWTGTEMIVWGGYDPDINVTGIQALASGARYNPATDAWVLLPSLPREAGRYLHTATWTGRDVIFWGGIGPYSDPSATGLRFRPATSAWRSCSTEGAPMGRVGHSAVWSGSDLLIWGGLNGATSLADGARYSPGADEWTPLATANAPSARSSHTAVWAGTRMFLFGGNNATTTFNDIKLLYPARTLFIYQQP